MDTAPEAGNQSEVEYDGPTKFFGEPFYITEHHLFLCVAVALAVLVGSLGVGFFVRLLERQRKRRARERLPPSPPPLDRLAAELPSANRTPHGAGPQQPASPFSSFKMVFSTRSPRTEQTPQMAVRSPTPPATLQWTVSKQERERRRQLKALQTPTHPPAQPAISSITPAQQSQPGGGWDADLLARSQMNTAYITSVEGLESSRAFQAWKSNNTEKYLLQNRIATYKDLRKLDPDGFRVLMTRREVMDYELVAPARILPAAEYLLTVLTTTLCLAMALLPGVMGPGTTGATLLATSGGVARWAPLLLWLILQRRAWLQGHSSVYASWLGLFMVYDDEVYEDHQQLATFMQLAVSCLLEAVFLGGTLLVGGLVYSLPQLLLPSDSRLRRCFAHRMMGLYVVAESKRRTTLPKYPLSPSAQAFSPTAGFGRRYGVPSPNSSH